MVILPVAAGAAGGVPTRREAASAGFASLVEEAKAPPALQAPAAPYAAPPPPDPEADRRTARRSARLLAGLRHLQAALLSGSPDAGLEATAALLSEAEGAQDPALAALCRAVECRARIELARRSLANS